MVHVQVKAGSVGGDILIDGQPVKDVREVHLSASADGAPQATLVYNCLRFDFEGDAEVLHVCPHGSEES